MDPAQPAVTSLATSDCHDHPPAPARPSSALERRLRAEDPARIVLVADCDATLAIKPADNFHFLSLLQQQHSTFRRAVANFALSIVLTARGEQSTLDIMHGTNQEHGLIPNLVLASNCGHHALMDAARYAEPDRFHHPIGTMTHEDTVMLRDAIHGLLETIRRHYTLNSGRLILDPRELCGAIIWEAMEEDQAKALIRLAQHEMGQLDPHVQPLLHYDSKHFEIGGKIYGYMDFKPYGMDKGSSMHALFNHGVIADRLPANPLVVVAGDSWPDYAMMQAAVERFGAENVINICVGNDPAFRCVGDDDTRMTDVEIHRIPGRQEDAIPALYRVLDAAALPSMRAA